MFNLAGQGSFLTTSVNVFDLMKDLSLFCFQPGVQFFPAPTFQNF